jgi:hypothetical protein
MAKKSKLQESGDGDGGETDIPPLSAKEIAEIKRQIADADDPTRYVIVSPFSRRFCLYYLPESGNYIMNEIPVEALFKRKAEARAVAEVLDRDRHQESNRRRAVGGVVKRGRRRTPRRTLQVIAVKKTKRGVRILDEVADPWNKGQHWKPALRRRRER